MNIDIEQLDSEEKNKIRELVRDRNDKDREKGVEYIFRRNDDKEQYLLGKKLDLNQMAKDEKALMGESEAEFQERMEHRKLLEKMREDPMAIIQMNDQQARKIAMEKKKVHDRLTAKNRHRYNRMESSSESDSEESETDYLGQLRSLLAKHADDDENPLEDVIARRNKGKERDLTKITEKNGEKDKKREKIIEKSHKKDRKREKNTESRRKRSKSRSRSRNISRKAHRNISRERIRSRSQERYRKKRENKFEEKSYRKTEQQKHVKMSEEEKQSRIKEMKQNAEEHSLRCSLLERKYRLENESEAAEMEKQMKNYDAVIFSNTIKMNQNTSLRQTLDERQKQSRIKQIFKK